MRLEVVGVQHRDRERPRVPLGAIDLLAQHVLDVAAVEDAGQRIVRRLLEQVLARLPLRGDVDDRRQQRVVAREAQALSRQARPERSPARGPHLGLEVVDAPVAEDVLQVAVALGQVHPVLGRVAALDLVQRHLEHRRRPPVGQQHLAVGDPGQHHRDRREVDQRAQVGLALLQLAGALRDLALERVALDAQRVLGLVPGRGLQHQRHEVRERAGEQLLVQLPAPRPAGVLVADDAHHLAAQEHGRVEHRRDAERHQVALAELAGALVGARVVGADRALALQRREVARRRRRR